MSTRHGTDLDAHHAARWVSRGDRARGLRVPPVLDRASRGWPGLTYTPPSPATSPSAASNFTTPPTPPATSTTMEHRCSWGAPEDASNVVVGRFAASWPRWQRDPTARLNGAEMLVVSRKEPGAQRWRRPS